MDGNYEEFLTIPETAKLLRINLGRAYSMARNGTLPGVIRIGRTIRVSRQTLLEELPEVFGNERGGRL